MEEGIMLIAELSVDQFDAFVDENCLLVIEFTAKWCVPCQSFAKVLEQAAKNNPDVKFATIDIEENPDLAEEFSLRSVPFVLIIQNRTALYAESGTLTVSVLDELLQQARLLTHDDGGDE